MTEAWNIELSERLLVQLDLQQDKLEDMSFRLWHLGFVAGMIGAIDLEEDTLVTANEIMDAATADATIDEALRRDPADLTKIDYINLIAAFRVKRAMFIEAEDKKQMKKQGIEETSDGEDEAGE